ncbi:acyl-CoA dehydrogenase [Candidatus Rariloculus sp.]|uniref:acyl-CoA dehydrogenase n=1 Tax=Candidatus Rariloculus sp. TaxID=3101265 RepID=UPI003D0DE693
MSSIFWFIVLSAAPIALAYRRVDLKKSTLVLGAVLLVYTIIGAVGILWTLFLWILFAAFAALNLIELRREHLSNRLLEIARGMLPQMSTTEQDALEAGNVWWEGELFGGMPDWRTLMELPAPKLTDEEQAFLDGPTEQLCRMLDDWQITHELCDMPADVWEFIKSNGFFSMIIPKEYGGLGFSPLANSMVLTKISSRNITAASTIGVPNSLGPAELLLHYGTEEQKQRWLPELASAREIPCFALTSPRAGSDATAITDTGVVCTGTFEGRETLGIRLNWEKRYITLAPVATVLGLAFKLHDPEHLIGDKDEYGITAALIPTNLPGIEIGRRHFPINIPFQNGPTEGKDVFVPVDSIIGGPKMAGQGWRMLVQQLSVGRSVTLPSNALGGVLAGVYASGAYARLRRQFGLPIGKFHGVGEALARMAGYAYTMKAASRVTCTALNAGERPAVPSAILKYHNTEMARAVANDAMDVHGGKAIMLGPRNYLARNYQSLPISITVEGANILTRNLIIFGQGAIRCHPYVRTEMEAARDADTERGLAEFDRAIFAHAGYVVSNAARSLVLALTQSRFTRVPANGATRRYYQHINRYSASFALAADAAMLTLGGALKRKELLSARLGDVLSYIYLASMVLKHYRDQDEPDADLPLVEWACRTLMYRAQEQLHGFLRNFPNRWVAAVLRVMIFPRGRTFSAPSDELGQQIVELMINPTETRERLADCSYTTLEPTNPLGLLQEALEMAERVKVLERKVLDARRAGEIVSEDTPGQIDEAERKGVLTATEAVAVRAFDDKVMALTGVDDFDAAELGRTQAGATPTASAPRSVNKKTPRPARKKPSRSVKKKPQRKKAVQQRSETAAED